MGEACWICGAGSGDGPKHSCTDNFRRYVTSLKEQLAAAERELEQVREALETAAQIAGDERLSPAECRRRILALQPSSR